jgi:lipoprotein signal peptidase
MTPKKEFLKYRAIQLDLARQMETIPYITNFIDFIAVNNPGLALAK